MTALEDLLAWKTAKQNAADAHQWRLAEARALLAWLEAERRKAEQPKADDDK